MCRNKVKQYDSAVSSAFIFALRLTYNSTSQWLSKSSASISRPENIYSKQNVNNLSLNFVFWSSFEKFCVTEFFLNNWQRKGKHLI